MGITFLNMKIGISLIWQLLSLKLLNVFTIDEGVIGDIKKESTLRGIIFSKV